jgi:hypothetical protein
MFWNGGSNFLTDCVGLPEYYIIFRGGLLLYFCCVFLPTPFYPLWTYYHAFTFTYLGGFHMRF